MSIKVNSRVTVQTGRSKFEDGKVLKIMRSGKLKILFDVDGEYDLIDPRKVKPALPKKSRKAIVEGALEKMERKAGRDPSEHVGAWDKSETRVAVAKFAKRAGLSDQPYYVMRAAYEAKNGPIAPLTASERAQIVRENREAEKAIMAASEARIAKAPQAAPVNSAITGSTHHLMNMDMRRLANAIKHMRAGLVFLYNGKMHFMKPAGMMTLPSERDIAKLRETAKAQFTKKDPAARLVFLNGMNDASLLQALAGATA